MRNLNCLITGASSGIGASIAQELSKTDKHIYILSRNTTKLEKVNDKIISNGGRVLGVTALGSTLQNAIDNAYDACKKIQWSNKYQRNDIGKKGLSSL